jgi:hypothetical protein
VSLITAHFGFHIPGGDIAERFGADFNIGGAFLIKTGHNFLLGAEGNFIFGGQVKDKDLILADISTSQGYVIDRYGNYADIFFYERGFSTFFRLGKVIPVIGPNPNSGLYATGGVGYLQHKVRIENKENTAPQVEGDYKKGYDQLTGGFAISEQVGYINLSNKYIFNFSAGFECIQSWTKALRSYDFNLMGKDTSRRLDLFFGMKFSWFIPLYKKAPDKYYYF